jgi:hypothetical protein
MSSPYRRVTPAFADDGARLGADVVRYSIIAVDLHHLILSSIDWFGLMWGFGQDELLRLKPVRGNARRVIAS